MNEFVLEVRPDGMSAEVLERAVGAFLAAPLLRHVFAFQGGEPLRAGVDFYGAFAEMVRRHTVAGRVRPDCRMLTDGTLLTDEWAQFFAAHGFVVSVSLDGPPGLCGNAAAHASALSGIGRLKTFDVPFAIHTAVSRANAEQPEAVYHYLRDDVGCRHHRYDPCMGMAGTAITGEQWGGFLCGLYDAWYPADTQSVSVRLFDTILAQMVQGLEAMCECSSDCRHTLVIEPSGDVYPCALCVSPEWRLGNVLQDDIPALLESPLYEAFGQRKRKWPPKCNACDALRYCRGDCAARRDGDGGSALCSGWQAFYAHAMPTLSRLGWQIYQKVNGLKPGRNDPCPCGSGKKLKKCCGPRPQPQ